MNIPPEAIELLKELKENGITAYIAGGALRDWHMGNEPKDLDIWFFKDVDDSYPPALGGEKPKRYMALQGYTGALGISSIYKGNFKGYDYDQIQYNSAGIHECVAGFDCPVNMAFMDYTGKVTKTPEFLDAHSTKTAVIKINRPHDTYYRTLVRKDRLTNRLPGYTVSIEGEIDLGG